MFQILERLSSYFNVAEQKIKFNVLVAFYFLMPKKRKQSDRSTQKNIGCCIYDQIVTKPTCSNFSSLEKENSENLCVQKSTAL